MLGFFFKQMDFTSKLFLAPSTPGNSRMSLLSNYMLVDKSLITMDGSECNKIGVSYAGIPVFAELVL
jgi:hypothetical protein